MLPGENWYAFLPEKSGKVEAITELAGSLHIALDDTVSFGDDANDVEMLAISGVGSRCPTLLWRLERPRTASRCQMMRAEWLTGSKRT